MKKQIFPKSEAHKPTGQLRLIETTDLHMQLLDYDHFSDQPDTRIGLIGLADQINALQSEDGVTTLLCDNGDLLQGNPLADHLAEHHTPNTVHPMIAALNLLGYDAATLGNHEFDYGLDFLQHALRGANFPFVSANITCMNGAALAKPFTILDRQILCDDGATRDIKIGITGFGRPQVSKRDHQDHDDGIMVDDIIGAAQQVMPQIHAAKADVIIALCHAGIGGEHQTTRMENAAIPLAAVDGIDVLLMGHTHEAFPDPTLTNSASIDYANGTLHGKPAVMAAFYGKSIGVIDLKMLWDNYAWQIADHSIRLEKPQASQDPESPLRQKLRSLVAQPHAATIAQMQQPISRTNIPITSYFATVQPDLSQQLLARAIQRATKTMLANSGRDLLPVLAAKSSYRFGGRGGLGHYIDIPQGPITLRDAAAIFPFADRLCAVRRTGLQIKMWLERAAAHYNQMQCGKHDQRLINPQSAGYNCDTIFGLTYQIDLTQPARFDTSGLEINADAARIRNLAYKGNPVLDTDLFIVGTNNFRAKGGGGFPHIASEDILYTSQRSLREFLINYLSDIGTITDEVQQTWSFSTITQTSATFESAPDARHHLSGPISHAGPSKDGFDTYRIQF